MHLLPHRQAGRDIFVTCDEGILGKRCALSDRFGLLAASPEECVAWLRSVGVEVGDCEQP